ncbi:PH domain-containing protein [Neptunicella marina]|uniref:PH domain-containing protein n=1 Tax=Neptunicella marina TaxID=2125989 RepID=A0A8J6IX05_9ALTE|nr:PH domain-containing protein [Neptunicella marina]MBC3767097.1 PH domain-containing protein [Neptunicella marina]
MYKFSSKKDLWLMVIIYGTAVMSFGAVLKIVSQSADIVSLGIALFVFIMGVVAPMWLIRSTRYLINHSHLLIQSGPFKWTIRLADIYAIKPSKNPVSSPALSLDRLDIYYADNKHVLISPADKQAFIKALNVKFRP